MRIVKSAEAGMALVYESEPAGVGARTLVCEAVSGRVRLETYPSNWRSLADPELLALFQS